VYENAPAFINMDQLVKALDLKREIEMTAADYYAAEKGLNERYLREIVQSATRVNYGQDLDELHALGSHVSAVLLEAVLLDLSLGMSQQEQSY
jgi:prenylcysteine oxidase/farnesylcysteine lyase